jgi:hypothetical protein
MPSTAGRLGVQAGAPLCRPAIEGLLDTPVSQQATPPKHL